MGRFFFHRLALLTALSASAASQSTICERGEEGLGEAYWYPFVDLHGNGSCVHNADYPSSYYTIKGNCELFLFESKAGCCKHFPDACSGDNKKQAAMEHVTSKLTSANSASNGANGNGANGNSAQHNGQHTSQQTGEHQSVTIHSNHVHGTAFNNGSGTGSSTQHTGGNSASPTANIQKVCGQGNEGQGKPYWYPHIDGNKKGTCVKNANYPTEYYANKDLCELFLYSTKAECCLWFPDACDGAISSNQQTVQQAVQQTVQTVQQIGQHTGASGSSTQHSGEHSGGNSGSVQHTGQHTAGSSQHTGQNTGTQHTGSTGQHTGQHTGAQQNSGQHAVVHSVLPDANYHEICDKGGQGSSTPYWYPHIDGNGKGTCVKNANYPNEYYVNKDLCELFLYNTKAECCMWYPDACEPGFNQQTVQHTTGTQHTGGNGSSTQHTGQHTGTQHTGTQHTGTQHTGTHTGTHGGSIQHTGQHTGTQQHTGGNGGTAQHTGTQHHTGQHNGGSGSSLTQDGEDLKEHFDQMKNEEAALLKEIENTEAAEKNIEIFVFTSLIIGFLMLFCICVNCIRSKKDINMKRDAPSGLTMPKKKEDQGEGSFVGSKDLHDVEIC